MRTAHQLLGCPCALPASHEGIQELALRGCRAERDLGKDEDGAVLKLPQVTFPLRV